MNMEQIVAMMKSRAQRRYRHGMHGKYDRLIKKLRIAKKNAVVGEKPKGVRTHLRNAIIVPEMCGSVVDCYGGKYWNPIEVKADMIGTFLAEYSLTYKPMYKPRYDAQCRLHTCKRSHFEGGAPTCCGWGGS